VPAAPASAPSEARGSSAACVVTLSPSRSAREGKRAASCALTAASAQLAAARDAAQPDAHRPCALDGLHAAAAGKALCPRSGPTAAEPAQSAPGVAERQRALAVRARAALRQGLLRRRARRVLAACARRAARRRRAAAADAAAAAAAAAAARAAEGRAANVAARELERAQLKARDCSGISRVHCVQLCPTGCKRTCAQKCARSFQLVKQNAIHLMAARSRPEACAGGRGGRAGSRSGCRQAGGVGAGRGRGAAGHRARPGGAAARCGAGRRSGARTRHGWQPAGVEDRKDGMGTNRPACM